MVGKKPIHPVRVVIFSLSVVCALVAGFLAGSHDFIALMRNSGALKDRNNELEKDMEECQQAAVNLEVADKVNKLAQEKLRQRVNELQNERVNMESELYVYKKLAENDDSEIGLNIESLTIRKSEAKENHFYYEMLLRRKPASSKSVEATVSLKIEGRLDGAPHSVSFREADPELNQDALSVNFKYFKVIKGAFILPERFHPEIIVTSLYETGQEDSLAIKEISWETASTP